MSLASSLNWLNCEKYSLCRRTPKEPRVKSDWIEIRWLEEVSFMVPHQWAKKYFVFSSFVCCLFFQFHPSFNSMNHMWAEKPFGKTEWTDFAPKIYTIRFKTVESLYLPNTNIFSKQIDSEDFNCIDLLNGSQPFTMMAECEWERETKLERAHRYKWWQSHPISKTKMPIWSHKLWRKIFVLLGFSFSFVWLIIQQKNCVEATTSSSSRKRAALVVVVVGCAFRPDVIFSCVSDSRKLHCFENIEYLSIGCFSLNDFCIFRRLGKKNALRQFRNIRCPYFIIFKASRVAKTK